jgi:hypothetical protein
MSCSRFHAGLLTREAERPFRGLLVLAAAAVAAAIAPALGAQPQATATLGYDVRSFGSLTPVRDDCNGRFTFNASAFGQNPGDSYLPPAPFTGTCDLRNTSGTPLAFGGRAEVFSYAQKPAAFDPANPSDYKLAKLGARAEIVTELRQWDPLTGQAPAGDPATGRWSAGASANFSDFLRVVDPTNPSVRVSLLFLEFELTGSFTIGPFPGAGGFGGANAGFTLFVSQNIDGGYAFYERNRSQSGPDLTVGRGEQTSTTTDGPITEAGPCKIGKGPTCIRLAIGPTFFDVIGQTAVSLFDNGIPIPRNVSDIALELGLTANVSSADVAYFDRRGSTINERITRADFANTLSFVGVEAFDAENNDITSVLRFESLENPMPPTVVPEPGSIALLAVGLGGLLVAVRRRSHRS